MVSGPHALLHLADRANLRTTTGKGLEQLSTEELTRGFQSSEENPMLGVDSRAMVLRSLGTSLLSHPDTFGVDGRPGNIVGE